MTTRTEKDLLGERLVPESELWGIHTLRAQENFCVSGRAVHPELVKAYGCVKLAAARVNRMLGVWSDSATADAIERACVEMSEGSLTRHIVVDSLQGGAGTSTNMNVNEVIANRALELLGHTKGSYETISPFDDINCHQSTNDTFPTALRVAAIRLLRNLDRELVGLQEAFQRKEREFADIVKVARTELQDAVLLTLGREMGAYAEAFNRDRWRVSKCEERLRVVNLGGTAVGTGLGAPREYLFRVVDELRAITGIGFARAEDLVDATQNADVFVEVSGILKACASNVLKVSSDLRLLSSGPDAGFGEISLPAVQAGSSIMPGKVNPVIPEAAAQAAMLVMGHDCSITIAVSSGNLDLNQNLPLIAHCLLESLDALANASRMLRDRCVSGITANRDKCASWVDGSTATATALVRRIGYEAAAKVVATARATGKTIREVAVQTGLVSETEFAQLTSPEAVCRLGDPDNSKRGGT